MERSPQASSSAISAPVITERVSPAPPYDSGNGALDEAQLPALLDDAAGNLPALIGLVRHRPHLLRREAGDRVANELLFFARLETNHASSLSRSCRRAVRTLVEAGTASAMY